jgi:putative membrane protein insertion efficiency factor
LGGQSCATESSDWPVRACAIVCPPSAVAGMCCVLRVRFPAARGSERCSNPLWSCWIALTSSSRPPPCLSTQIAAQAGPTLPPCRLLEVLGSPRDAMKTIVLWCIRFYQRSLSRALPPSCRFVPSCSEYARQAIEKHGLARGGWLAAKRISRCHPLNPGGYDPVP